MLDHGQYIMGPEVAAFEKEFACFTGVKHCVSCANGTDALQMLYMAYGIGQGDAVFCPDVTFIATIEPACTLGAVPVFCDIEMATFNLCPASLERQIQAVLKEGKYTPKAVAAVDLLGNAADYESIHALCEKYRLILIEDAAQSVGASARGRMCGSFGDSSAVSFFPAKPLGCYGDGGAVLTDDDSIAGLCKSLRVHGKGAKGKYHNERIGLNSRLDTLQAAILLPKLQALKEHETAARQRAANYYNQHLQGHYTLQFIPESNASVYAQYVLLAETETGRGEALEKLKEAEIPAMVYYPAALHELEVFQSVPHYGESFAHAQSYCRRTFSLPMHPYLTEGEQRRVVDALV